MILGEREAFRPQGGVRAGAVKPCRGNEARDRAAEHVFEQAAALDEAAKEIEALLTSRGYYK